MDLTTITDLFKSVFTNPMTTHIMTFLVGWLALPQLTVFKTFWSTILGVSKQVDNFQDLIKMVDAMLKVNGVIPVDSPPIPPDAIKAVVSGTIPVSEVKKMMVKMKATQKK
jgi:hypothetical protein